jgi:hypothetical protein
MSSAKPFELSLVGVEMLFCTSLIVLVGAANYPQLSPRNSVLSTKVCNIALPPAQMCTQSLSAELDDMRAPVPVFDVKRNRTWLGIVLEMEIYIYDISNTRLLRVIETSPNPEGVLCYPLFPRKLLLNILGSYLCSIAISRQFRLGISVPCTLTDISTDQCRRNHFLIHTLLPPLPLPTPPRPPKCLNRAKASSSPPAP